MLKPLWKQLVCCVCRISDTNSDINQDMSVYKYLGFIFLTQGKVPRLWLIISSVRNFAVWVEKSNFFQYQETDTTKIPFEQYFAC